MRKLTAVAVAVLGALGLVSSLNAPAQATTPAPKPIIIHGVGTMRVNGHTIKTVATGIQGHAVRPNVATTGTHYITTVWGSPASCTVDIHWSKDVVNGRNAVTVDYLHLTSWSGNPWIASLGTAFYDLPSTTAYNTGLNNWNNGVTHTPWVSYGTNWRWSDDVNPLNVQYAYTAYGQGQGCTGSEYFS